jgi:hypothetical protein
LSLPTPLLPTPLLLTTHMSTRDLNKFIVA